VKTVLIVFGFGGFTKTHLIGNHNTVSLLSERRDGFLPVRSIEILAVQKNNILSVIVSGFTSMYAMRMG